MTVYDFNKGDLVRIIKRPNQWSSRFSNRDLRDSLKYPFEAVIDDISGDKEHCLMAGGGWALDSLVNGGCIELIQNKEIEPLFIN